MHFDPFDDCPELQSIARSVRDFCETHVAPYAKQLHIITDADVEEAIRLVAAYDETEDVRILKAILAVHKDERFPAELVKHMGDAGYLGATISEEYGGAGMTVEQYLPVMEGIAAHDGSLALTLAAHHSLCAAHILEAGTEEQKKAFLPDLAQGLKIGAWCLTEPDAGSAIFSKMRTTLRQAGSGFVLNGEKTFVTNGTKADTYVVMARFIAENSERGGITACIVPRENSGRISTLPLHGKFGVRASDTASVTFDDVIVRGDHILGGVGQAAASIANVLYRGRIGIAAMALGIARDSFERAIKHAKDREVSGGLLAQQQHTRMVLAEMQARLWTAWAGVIRAARRADSNQPFTEEACMAKWNATESALWICEKAIRMLGGQGYMADGKVERNFRDMFVTLIGEGTSDVLLLTIAKQLFET